MGSATTGKSTRGRRHKPSPNRLIKEFVDELVTGMLSLNISPESMREFLWRLHSYQMRDIERYGENIRCKWRTVMRALALLGKISCAYNSVLLPYLHLNIKRLESILDEVEEFSESLNLKAERGDYVKDIDVEFTQKGTGLYIHYRLLPPISLLPTRALLRTASEKLLPMLGEKSELGEMPLCMVEAVLKSYEEASLDSKAEILKRELEAASGRGRQEDGLGMVLEYLKEFKKCEKNNERIRKRVSYPFYVILGPSLGRDEDVCRAYRHGREEEWLISDLRESKDPRSSHFLTAFDVRTGQLKDETTLRKLVKELRAHAGICYLSVKNVLEEGGKIKIIYYKELFDKIDWEVRVNKLFEILEESLNLKRSSSLSTQYYWYTNGIDMELGDHLWSLCDLLSSTKGSLETDLRENS